MKGKKAEYESKASAKDYYVALAYFPNFLKLLNSEGKVYNKLIQFLLEREVLLKDDEMSLPTIKELSFQLDINPSKISKHLKLIYDEILELNWKEPHLFMKEGQINCCLSFKFLGVYQGFYIGLDFIPKVGENLDFYFIKPKLGCNSFYVKKIYHDIDYNGHSIMISLSPELPNSYLNLLKGKAYLSRELSLKEFLDSETPHAVEEELLRKIRNL